MTLSLPKVIPAISNYLISHLVYKFLGNHAEARLRYWLDLSKTLRQEVAVQRNPDLFVCDDFVVLSPDCRKEFANAVINTWVRPDQHRYVVRFPTCGSSAEYLYMGRVYFGLEALSRALPFSNEDARARFLVQHGLRSDEKSPAQGRGKGEEHA